MVTPVWVAFALRAPFSGDGSENASAVAPDIGVLARDVHACGKNAGCVEQHLATLVVNRVATFRCGDDDGFEIHGAQAVGRDGCQLYTGITALGRGLIRWIFPAGAEVFCDAATTVSECPRKMLLAVTVFPALRLTGCFSEEART